MALEDIINYILKEAEEKKKYLLQEAEKEKEKILEKAEEEGKILYKEILEKGLIKIKKEMESLLIEARLERKNKVLALKQSIIQKVFEEIKKEFKELKFKKEVIYPEKKEEIFFSFEELIDDLKRKYIKEIEKILFD